MKSFPTQLTSQAAAALKPSARRSAIKQLLASSVIVLIFSAGLALSPLRIGAGSLAHKAAPNPTRIELARLSEEVTIHAAGRGNPWINLSNGHELITPYSGPAEVTRVLERNRAQPLSLCSADFDEDGVPDLISGYAAPNGGIITLLRGNVDSIYPNAPEAQQRRAEGTFTDAPFLSPAFVFGVPEAADFIGAGDFDGDGHWDVVAAARGGDKLYLLLGDGTGGLHQTKRIDLLGGVTAMVVGEINRRDGLDDVVVGVSGEQGPKVLVFEGPEGALRAKPETFDLSAEATSLALGQLDHEYPYDLAVASGNELLMVYGRDRKLVLDKAIRGDVQAPKFDIQRFPFRVKSLAIGRFTGGNDSDIALLGDDGNLHVLCRKDTASQSGRTNQQAARRKFNLIPEELASGNWSESAHLVTARISSTPVDNVLLVDSTEGRVEILGGSRNRSVNSEFKPVANARDHAMTAELKALGRPEAVLPMRLNSDALNDLVVLQSGQGGVAVTMNVPQATFVVDNTNDSGPGSLRQAIIDANNNSGMDQISFNILGAAPHSINLESSLPIVTETVVIDGTTQPGFTGNPLIEVNCFNAFLDGLKVDANGCLIRGLVVNRGFRSNISLFSSDSIVEGNYIGTDLSGTTVPEPQCCFPISFTEASLGVVGDNNTIGGTAANARNIVSMHIGFFPSIAIFGEECRVRGNFIDVDATGSRALVGGGTVVGTELDIAPGISPIIINNIVGGTQPGARNIMRGVVIFHPITAGTLVQGNFIGTDKDGIQGIGGAVFIFASSGNTVGGPITAARNVISAGGGAGVRIEVPSFFLEAFNTRAASNIVQLNFIGTDANGNEGLGHARDGVEVASGAVENFILDNRIASNSGGGIFLPDVEEPGKRIVLQGNLIYSNGGLGIDLGQVGITLNDSGDLDDGPNELQNFPQLMSLSLPVISPSFTATVSPSMVVAINGILNSTPNSTFTLEFFFGGNCPTQGAQFIGTLPIKLGSDQVTTDSNGFAMYSFPFEFPRGMRNGFINATATNSTGNTSEFSECFAVTNPTAPQITSVTKSGKKLIVEGLNFESDAKIFVNNGQQKTSFTSASKLIGKKAGKTIKAGDKVKVRNSDGTESNEVIF